MSSDFPIKGQWPDGEQQDSSKHYALSGKIMLASVITLFVVVVFLVLLHLYSRWYLSHLHRRNGSPRPNPANRSARIVHYISGNRALASGTYGLDASVLKSLPVFVYSSETGASMLECAVCLSEFEVGETGRILPNCKHRFHTGCIDMWFFSNSTCPLCRSPVEPVDPEMPVLTEQVEPVTPETGTTSSGTADGRKRVDVRIDVPYRNESVTEIEFRLPSPSQGFRSPGSRLLSLKRIMSMSRRSPVVSPSSGVGPSCAPVATESDLESSRQESGQESSRLGA
ncbi:hypothetical protein R6Q59_022108 [Mikania micrantha]|uniref:RING-type E3 ubiquitin transferase n=1 Tax=Mikania micrantha TaxID=192012 RepID=A0A5N6MWF0_9ASTR|nr:hypothetical protein E3N88_27102 [Mikania micrantha]